MILGSCFVLRSNFVVGSSPGQGVGFPTNNMQTGGSGLVQQGGVFGQPFGQGGMQAVQFNSVPFGIQGGIPFGGGAAPQAAVPFGIMAGQQAMGVVGVGGEQQIQPAAGGGNLQGNFHLPCGRCGTSFKFDFYVVL